MAVGTRKVTFGHRSHGLDIDTAHDWPGAMPTAAWTNPPPHVDSNFDRLELARTELKPTLQARLATNGFHTVGDIARKERHDIARLPNVGHEAMARIEAMLAGPGYMSYPQQHRAKLQSTTPLERLNGEIKRRTDLVGIFSNEVAITCSASIRMSRLTLIVALQSPVSSARSC